MSRIGRQQGRWIFRSILTIATVGTVIATAASLGVAQEENTAPPPLPQQGSVGPSGQTEEGTWVIPRIPQNVGQPEMHGEYRLVPYGYGGPLPFKYNFEPGELSRSQDESLAQTSPLYREPSFLPEGYSLTQTELFSVGGQDVALILSYRGDGFPIQIARVVPERSPIDIFLYAEDSFTSKEPGSIASHPAVFERLKSGMKYQAAIGVQFIEDGIETSVGWRVSDPGKADSQFQTVVKIAESLD